MAKPDPAIFRLALTHLNCEPQEAWFVGDNPELDVMGAIGAGLRGFWFERPGFTPPGPPVDRLQSLRQLLDLI